MSDSKVQVPALPPGTPPMVADPELLAKLLFNSMILYGPTGSRKTAQIGEFAEYIYEKTGKPTRLLTADGGGYGIIQNWVDAGIIIPWRLITEADPLSTLRKVSKGAWAEKLVNGVRQGKIIEVDRSKPENLPKSMSSVGAYAFESWYSIAALLICDVVDKGRKISEDVVSKFEENGEIFGAPARAHYGFAQKEVMSLIRNASALPVERILYTSVEGKGEDKLTKKTEYGPQVIGGAVTAMIPTYVGDCLHFEDYIEEVGSDPTNAKQKLVNSKVRVWFSQHPDVQTPNIFWPAKTRVVTDQIQNFRDIMGKNGYFLLPDASTRDTHSGLYKYLKAEDDLLNKSTQAALDFKARIDKKFAENK